MYACFVFDVFLLFMYVCMHDLNLYVRMYVCVYVCIYICVCVCMYVRMYVYMYDYLSETGCGGLDTHMYVYTYICGVYICVYIYACMHARPHTL